MRVNTIQNTTTYKPLQFKAELKIESDIQQRMARLANDNDFKLLRQLCEAFKHDKTEYCIDANCFYTEFRCARGNTVIAEEAAIGFIRDALLKDLISRNTPEDVNSAYKTLVDAAYENKYRYLQSQMSKIREEIGMIEQEKAQRMNNINDGNQKTAMGNLLFEMRKHI